MTYARFNRTKNYEVIVKEEGSNKIQFRKTFKGSTLNRIINILETSE